MKKLIYVLLLSFVCAATITSCTEEPVTPKNETSADSGGAGGSAGNP